MDWFIKNPDASFERPESLVDKYDGLARDLKEGKRAA
jgi:hypothetical protein